MFLLLRTQHTATCVACQASRSYSGRSHRRRTRRRRRRRAGSSKVARERPREDLAGRLVTTSTSSRMASDSTMSHAPTAQWSAASAPARSAEVSTRSFSTRARTSRCTTGIVFYRGGNVVAQRFDQKSLTVTGSPQPIAESVEYFNARETANFSVSSNGLLVYRSASARLGRPTWFDRDGRMLGPGCAGGGLPPGTSRSSCTTGHRTDRLSFSRRSETAPVSTLR